MLPHIPLFYCHAKKHFELFCYERVLYKLSFNKLKMYNNQRQDEPGFNPLILLV